MPAVSFRQRRQASHRYTNPGVNNPPDKKRRARRRKSGGDPQTISPKAAGSNLVEAQGQALIAPRTYLPWTPEEDQRLLDMRAAGATVASIAKVLNRTQEATNNRLVILKKREVDQVE